MRHVRSGVHAVETQNHNDQAPQGEVGLGHAQLVRKTPLAVLGKVNAVFDVVLVLVRLILGVLGKRVASPGHWTDLAITQEAHRREVAVIGLKGKVAGGGKRAFNHDEVVGPEGWQDDEVRDRVLVREAGVDFLRPDAEAWLAVQGEGAVQVCVCVCARKGGLNETKSSKTSLVFLHFSTYGAEARIMS